MPELSVLLKTKDQTTPEFKKVDEAARKLTRDMKKYGVEGGHALDIVEKEFRQLAQEAKDAGVKGTAGMKQLTDQIDRLKNKQNQAAAQSKLFGESLSMGAIATAAGMAIERLAEKVIQLGVEFARFSIDSYKQIDDAFDKIRIGTGATGDDLEKMQAQAQSLFVQLPVSMDQAATTIADFNTQLGLTGPSLEEISKQTLQLKEIIGEDKVAVQDITRLFGDWSIATDKQSKTLDFMYKADQATGAGFDYLSKKVVESGTVFRTYGFSLEETTTLLAKWQKEGVTSEKILSGLTQGLGYYAKAHKDPQKELASFIEKVKAAKKPTDVMTEAVKIFGKRAATDLVMAIREGRFEIDDLQKAIEGSTETIDKAFYDALGPTERYEIQLNRLKTAAAPLGETLLDSMATALEKNMPEIESGIAAIAESIAFLTGSMKGVDQDQQGFWNSFKGTIKEIGIAIKETASEPFAGEFAEGDKEIIQEWKAAWVEFLGYDSWGAFADDAKQSVEGIKRYFSDMWDNISKGQNKFVNSIENAINSSLNFIEGAFDSAVAAIKGTLDEIGISFDLSDYGEAFDGMVQIAGEKWAELQSLASSAWQDVQDVFNNAISALGSTYDQLKSDMAAAWNNIKSSAVNIATGMFTDIKNVFSRGLSDLSTMVVTKGVDIINAFMNIKNKVDPPEDETSIIPAMWADIKMTWAAGLDNVIKQTRDATPEITSAFGDMAAGVGIKLPDLPFMDKPDRERGKEKPEARARREANEAAAAEYKSYQDRISAKEWFDDQYKTLDIAKYAEGAARDEQAQKYKNEEEIAAFNKYLEIIKTDNQYYLDNKATFDQIERDMKAEQNKALQAISDEGKRADIDRQWGLVQEKLSIEEYFNQAMTQAADKRLQEAFNYADAAERLAKAKGKTELGIAIQFGTAALGELANTSKDMFELNKNVGIANAIINAYVGISGVLAEYPGPLGWAMAASQAAIAWAQVQNIASQTFEGGGSGSSGGGGGMGGGGIVGSTAIPAAGTEAGRMGAFNSTIDFRRLKGKMIVGDAADIYESFWDQLDDRFKRNASFTFM
jgi:phage-related minor tail protein